MGLSEWTEILKALATGVGLAIPIVTTMTFFHSKRSERFDSIAQTQEELKGSVKKLDTDFDGLIKQIAGIVHDVEARFVTKEENTVAIRRLDGNIMELNRTIGQLNDHLFDLARKPP